MIIRTNSEDKFIHAACQLSCSIMYFLATYDADSTNDLADPLGITLRGQVQ